MKTGCSLCCSAWGAFGKQMDFQNRDCQYKGCQPPANLEPLGNAAHLQATVISSPGEKSCLKGECLDGLQCCRTLLATHVSCRRGPTAAIKLDFRGVQESLRITLLHHCT
ncbi:uncharacterized protein LOC143842420 [Paroedura picta]|uniref:uncharacterized protein LOC143842420 n=1 Tax=Paroedura picta TaxID=143630 RepID=UPI0040579882